jgi:hypothetical protein
LAVALRRLLTATTGLLLACSLSSFVRAEWILQPLPSGAKILPNPWVIPCDPAVWFQDRVKERGESIVDAQCGDLRGDGVIRMYAHLKDSHRYIELENTVEGPHTARDIFNAGPFVPLVTFGLGSNAPKPSIFMSEGVRVRELYWNGSHWVTRLIESSYHHVPRALIADNEIRKDGRTRVYGECTEFLTEYVLRDGKWTATIERIRPKYEYSKTTKATVGIAPNIGRGIVLLTDNNAEFIAWSSK